MSHTSLSHTLSQFPVIHNLKSHKYNPHLQKAEVFKTAKTHLNEGKLDNTRLTSCSEITPFPLLLKAKNLKEIQSCAHKKKCKNH